MIILTILLLLTLTFCLGAGVFFGILGNAVHDLYRPGKIFDFIRHGFTTRVDSEKMQLMLFDCPQCISGQISLYTMISVFFSVHYLTGYFTYTSIALTISIVLCSVYMGKYLDK